MLPQNCGIYFKIVFYLYLFIYSHFKMSYWSVMWSSPKELNSKENGKLWEWERKKKHVVFISYCRISFLKIFFILVLLLIFAVVLLFFFCPKYVVKKQNRVYVEKYSALLTFKFWKQNGLWVWLTQNIFKSYQ